LGRAGAPQWKLEGFEEALDRWIATETPDQSLRIVVTQWVLTRFDDPYIGVWRADGFENLWFGTVPTSLHGDDMVVTCSYWIYEGEHRVRCDSIATLSLPI